MLHFGAIFSSGTDVTATMPTIGVKFCVMVSSGQLFFTIGGAMFRVHQMRGQKGGSDGPFLASQIPTFAI